MLIECHIDIDNGRGSENVVLSGYSDAIAVGYGRERKITFLSVLMRESDARTLAHNFNSYKAIAVRHRKYRKTVFDRNTMDIQTYRGREGYTHIVFSRRKVIHDLAFPAIAIFNDFTYDENNIIANRDAVIPQNILDGVFQGIVDNTSIPVLREWMDYVVRELIRVGMAGFCSLCVDEDTVYQQYGFRSVLEVNLPEHTVRNIIIDGLKHGFISVDGCNEMSAELAKVTGIDSYQETFGQILADRTQEEFKPLFNPETMDFGKNVNAFFDVATYYSKKFQPYEKQKEVIQSAAASLDRQSNVIISGETGAGKTLMGIGTVASHARKKNYSVLAMVPSKTIPEWVETIQGVIPLADVHVVTTLSEFMTATKNIKNPRRINPLWIVLSEETMKMNYEERPAVVWDKRKHCYVCPHCGRPIQSHKRRQLDGRAISTWISADIDDFLSKNDKNAKCDWVIDPKTGSPVPGCKNSLWTVARRVKDEPEDALSKNGWISEMNWVKVDGLGWIQRDNITDFKARLQAASYAIDLNAPKSWGGTLEKQIKAICDYETRGAVGRYLRRYSIAHYIRKHLNHCFDYMIGDEVHQLATDAKRGEAFGTVIGACWKFIGLTGTLSNGYAKGLFHLLFRTQTKKMLERGYGYGDISKFNKDYGVVESKEVNTGELTMTARGQEFRRISTKKTKKELPGISQVLVADFLINNLVAVKKEDIKKDLCKYTETPVGVEMDAELSTAYASLLDDIVETVTTSTGHRRTERRRAIKNALLTATMFLDQPFGLDTRRRDNGEVIELSDEVIRNKEKELIKIAKQHKENGEKMLIYVEYTQRLDLGNRLTRLLADEDINAIVMPKMAASKRQKWLTSLAKEGDVDAVIMNPAEVDVGVNLLDYTTIIFYETGTELTKIRQASQRSNRINQEHPVSVYFMYYKDSIQEDTLGAISQKLSASKSIEGDFSESALQSMTEDTDITMRLVKSIVNNEHIKVETKGFTLTGPAVNEETEDISEQTATEKEKAKEKVIELAKNRLQFSNRPKLRFIQIPVQNCVSLIA